MDILATLIVALVGYLLGSISFARLIGKLVNPQKDLTKTEFDVPGTDEKFQMTAVSATTASMHLGQKFGCLTTILDMLKVTIPVLILRQFYSETSYSVILAALAVVGHNWPLYHRFQGGRGFSPIYGGLVLFDWLAIPVTAILGMLFGLIVLRDVLMAYMAGLWFLIPWLWFRTHDLWYVVYAVAVNIAFAAAMIPDIKQYVKFRRENPDIDLKTAMENSDMGRGMLKLANRFGLMKDET